ncbi:MarR family winged helix-turn-helix transcriptional regulator [Arthrobacter sp. B6]|uniref:MarR family winged helix-turn-helix transcriptional regulator n=1 Tax=Arthrobacter sp. B6 TaxID=1570137 RepID=UPI00082DE41A|nr:MarR family transcriptional regulator [Arthrobacter sp. B6]
MTAEPESDLRDGCRLLSLAARLVQRRQDDALAPLGLTRAAVIALEGLAAGALNQEQLAAAVHAKSQTLGKILARMQIAGLVSRTRHPHDRRQLVIGLTGAGRDALAAAHQAEAQVLPTELGAQGWKTLREDLARFVTSLQNQDSHGAAWLPARAANRHRGSPAAEAPEPAAPPSSAQPVPITSRSRTREPLLKPAVHPSYQIKK